MTQYTSQTFPHKSSCERFFPVMILSPDGEGRTKVRAHIECTIVQFTYVFRLPPFTGCNELASCLVMQHIIPRGGSRNIPSDNYWCHHQRDSSERHRWMFCADPEWMVITGMAWNKNYLLTEVRPKEFQLFDIDSG